MTKQIQTFFDHVNHCNDSVTLLKHIAKMMALQQPEYTEAFAADELSDAMAISMVKYDNEHTARNYEVTCTYCGVTESSTFRARKLGKSLVDMVMDELSLDDYVKQVVDPVSKELAARVISKIEGPLSATECDIKVAVVDTGTTEAEYQTMPEAVAESLARPTDIVTEANEAINHDYPWTVSSMTAFNRALLVELYRIRKTLEAK